ncbi:MAG TPA: hypothetical protein VE422_01700 [Terriglobia bacterium]|nr:hypothetical protein [Terriglobia bacterium]
MTDKEYVSTVYDFSAWLDQAGSGESRKERHNPVRKPNTWNYRLMALSAPAGPRFKIGDNIKVVGPGEHLGKQGVVVDVVEPSTGDFVYRYRVRFSDGTSPRFFGFELESVQSSFSTDAR